MKIKLIAAFILLSCTTLFAQSNWSWGKTWRHPTSGGGDVYAICTDALGNVYETGRFNGVGMMFDTTTVFNSDTYGITNDTYIAKYDNNGNLIWVRGFFCPNIDAAWGIATDTAGNVFVTGDFAHIITIGPNTYTATPNYRDVFLVKYDTNGNLLWSKIVEGNRSTSSNSVSTDDAGNAYIAGNLRSHTTNFDNIVINHTACISNPFLAKYDPNGNVIWVRDGGDVLTAYANSVSVTSAGYAFICGYMESDSMWFGSTALVNTGNHNMFVVSYDPSGNVIWAKSASGSNRSHAASISVDDESNIFVTGDFTGTMSIGTSSVTVYPSGIHDMFLAKYDVSGNLLWLKSAGGIQTDEGCSVSADQWGNAYVTGASLYDHTIYFGSDSLVPPDSSYTPLFIFKYDPNGNVLCSDMVSAGGNFRNCVAADPFGNAFVGGTFSSFSPTPVILGSDTMSLTGPSSMFIAKYHCNNAVSINEESPAVSISIYPNPSEGEFTLRSDADDGEVFVFNMLGEIIYQAKINSSLSTIDLTGRASGIYFVNVKAGKEFFTQKMIIK